MWVWPRAEGSLWEPPALVAVETKPSAVVDESTAAAEGPSASTRRPQTARTFRKGHTRRAPVVAWAWYVKRETSPPEGTAPPAGAADAPPCPFEARSIAAMGSIGKRPSAAPPPSTLPSASSNDAPSSALTCQLDTPPLERRRRPMTRTHAPSPPRTALAVGTSSRAESLPAVKTAVRSAGEYETRRAGAASGPIWTITTASVGEAAEREESPALAKAPVVAPDVRMKKETARVCSAGRETRTGHGKRPIARRIVIGLGVGSGESATPLAATLLPSPNASGPPMRMVSASLAFGA